MYKLRLKNVATLLALSTMSISTYAVAPGFYMGLMMGPASSNSGEQQASLADGSGTTTVNPRSNQFGTRLFMGYKINNYAGWEGGLTLFSKVGYKAAEGVEISGANARIRDFDVVAKGSLPLGSFDIFGKAGLAIVYQTVSGGLNSDGKSAHTTKFSPTVGLGASYDLSQNWVTDLSWNRVMTGGVVKSMDFFALGISYHFVDVYCGQFLC